VRCLVTGATGHLGSYLVRRLLDDGHEVGALMRPESDPWRIADVLPRVRVVRGDLAAAEEAAAGVAAFAPETVFHLAWHGVTSGFRDDPRQIGINLWGSLRLLEAARHAGCRTWVGVGSQAEYGAVEGLLHEDRATRPQTLYGAAKLATGVLGERLCAGAGMRQLWLRLLAIYGPHDDERHLIPSVLLRLLAGETPSLTPGEQRWDYLYVEDAADALVRAALHSDAEGTYNLASGEAFTVRHVVETLRDLVDPALPLGLGDVPYGKGQIMHLQGDISRLRAATGWRPVTPLRDGLERTVEWYRLRAGGER
jgi:nucleoside-diphosphate-sugar epimerase